jgi:toxin ParE1/3/4
MKYQVFLVLDAESDLFDIFAFISSNDSEGRARFVYDKLKEVCSSLEFFPHRSHVPPEFERIGIDSFLQVHFKPYRIIYSVSGKRVFVHCVLDGRRDLQELLHRRLVR